MIEAIEKYFFKRYVKRQVVRGNSTAKTRALIDVIVRQWRSTFYEDNMPTTTHALHEILQKSIVKEFTP